MFQRLQQKWKVNGLQLLLILCTFAIGGSLTGYLGKKLMNLLAIDSRALWISIYIIVVTLIWPMAVLLVSIPFGQFKFFTGYLKKMGSRLRVGKSGSPKDGKSESLESGRPEVRKTGSSEPTPDSRLTTNDSRLLTPDSATVSPDSRLMTNDSRLMTNDSRLMTPDSRLPAPDSPLPTRLAIFASGAGSNAQKIIDHFRNSDHISVALIVCNKPNAGVLNIAARENIPALLIEKEQFFRGNAYVDELRQNNIDFIVLAGFLWKVPDALITAYPGKIVNIHPALLPNYGGKGMYGNYVHEAVIAAKEKESGITIHFVDGHYDNGDIILQARCPVLENDTAGSLASRIHQLEHAHYPGVIEATVLRVLPKSSKEGEIKEF